jgi:dolichyl-phosphate-mannose-protein mannosyltransferase
MILGFATFSIGIDTPVKQNFDEFHYIPAAKAFLQLEINRNWEHPPLGKYLIAMGIATFGDNPTGWRAMSVVFGAFILALTFLLAFELFESRPLAIQTTLLTLFNHLLYVQSRIAMLDIFMLAFIWLGLLTFLRAWKGQGPRHLYFSGIAFGFALACKWFSIVPWLTVVGIASLFQLFKYWRLRFPTPRAHDWFNQKHFEGVRPITLVLTLGVVPLLTYAATFLPFLFLAQQPYQLSDFWTIQTTMWDGQQRVIGAHPYASQWYDWIFLRRPMWYAFDREPTQPDIVRGVFMVGNPILMWLGVAAIVGSWFQWIKTRALSSFFIVTMYTAFYGAWIVIPRVVHFYYYYLPAGMMLSFALIDQIKRLPVRAQKWAPWLLIYACALAFIFFFPILSGMPIPAESFRRWMWFSSWI